MRGDEDGVYNLQRFTVLLVEDSHYILSILDELLRHMSVGNVLRAANGAEAIQRLKESVNPVGGGSRIDLIISDMFMSPIDGLTLLKWVREGKDSPNRFMPFVMMSGAADDEYVTKARDRGVSEFIAKPFSAKSVYQRILTVIDRPRQFVSTKNYFGPDRHRRNEEARGDDRRTVSERDVNVVYSNEKVVRPKSESEVYHFRLQNGLKEKAGGVGKQQRGSIPESLLQEADSKLERTAVEFHDWALEYLSDLSDLCAKAKQSAENSRREQFEKINILAHELRGQGGIFGYHLITTAGKSLYTITRLGCTTDDRTILIVKAHIDIMRIVFRDKIQGDGGKMGRALIGSLQDAIMRFRMGDDLDDIQMDTNDIAAAE